MSNKKTTNFFPVTKKLVACEMLNKNSEAIFILSTKNKQRHRLPTQLSCRQNIKLVRKLLDI